MRYAEYDSVSQGCFYIPPSETPEAEGDKLPRLFGGRESEAACRLREHALQAALRAIDSAFDRMCASVFRNVIAEIAEFCHESHANFTAYQRVPALHPVKLSLPMGFLCTGHGGSETTQLLHGISSEVQASNAVVRLSGHDQLPIKMLLKRVIDAVYAHTGTSATTVLPAHDFSLLTEWHESHRDLGIVVIIDNVETFDGTVLSDLLMTMGEWREEVPFTVIAQVSSLPSLVQQNLAVDCRKYCRPVYFDARQLDTFVDFFLREVLYGPEVSIAFSESSFKAIMDMFSVRSGSIDRLVQNVKLQIMTFFYSNALSIMPHLTTDNVEACVNEDFIQSVRNLDSFQSHVSEEITRSGPERERVLVLLEDGALMKTFLLRCQRLQAEYRAELGEVATFLQHCSKLSHRQASLAACIYNSLRPSFASCLLVKEVVDGVSHTEHEQLRALLAQIETNFTRLSSEERSSLDALKSVSDELTSLEQQAEEDGKAADVVAEQIPKNLRTDLTLRDTRSSSRSSRLSRKAHDSWTDMTMTPAKRLLSRLQKETADLCRSLINKRFVHYKHIPLYEAYFIDAISPAYEMINAPVRAAIQSALQSPNAYIRAVTGSDDTFAYMADTAIMYNLSRSASRLINIADLFTAFQAACSPQNDSGESDKVMAMRFWNAVETLKIHGFIAQHRTKPDFFIRQIYG